MGDSTAFYFAYGANMSREVLVGRRGLHPLSYERARLAGFRIVFDLAGIPFVEPAFASIEPREDEHVYGVLYRLHLHDVDRVKASEAPRYEWIDVDVEGAESGPLRARTLQNRTPVAGIVPSRRYLRILCDAARAASLPAEYIAKLEAQPSAYVPVASELVAASLWGVLGVVHWRALRRKRTRAVD